MASKSYTIIDPTTGLPLDKESLRGPKGEKGDNSVNQHLHTQTVAQTVWNVTHNMDIDPAGVMVLNQNGDILDGWGIQYLVSGSTLRLSFDIPSAGTARFS